jgi:hypothetical protein
MISGSCHCGVVQWRMDATPATATACNCSVCSRYGALWGYGCEGEGVSVSGPTQTYVWGRGWLGFHFCAACGNVAYWRALQLDRVGKRRMGFNLRLAPPDAVSALALIHHDTEAKDDLPLDGKCVADVWF